MLFVEEYGLIGGFGCSFYLLLFRFVVAYTKPIRFWKVSSGIVGFSMIFQAMVNMAVAVEFSGNWTDITVNK
jgi:cell division protein FtsW (lipid II flippase)